MRALAVGFRGIFPLRGDGLAVGAPAESSSATGINGEQEDEGAPASGAVYLFARDAGGWRQVGYVKRPPAPPGNSFAGVVAPRGPRGSEVGGGAEHKESRPPKAGQGGTPGRLAGRAAAR